MSTVRQPSDAPSWWAEALQGTACAPLDWHSHRALICTPNREGGPAHCQFTSNPITQDNSDPRTT